MDSRLVLMLSPNYHKMGGCVIHVSDRYVYDTMQNGAILSDRVRNNILNELREFHPGNWGFIFTVGSFHD